MGNRSVLVNSSVWAVEPSKWAGRAVPGAAPLAHDFLLEGRQRRETRAFLPRARASSPLRTMMASRIPTWHRALVTATQSHPEAVGVGGRVIAGTRGLVSQDLLPVQAELPRSALRLRIRNAAATSSIRILRKNGGPRSEGRDALGTGAPFIRRGAEVEVDGYSPSLVSSGTG